MSVKAEYVNDWKVSIVMWALEEVSDRIMEINTMRGFVMYSPHQSHSGDQTSEDEMEDSCGTCEGEDKYVQRFGGKM